MTTVQNYLDHVNIMTTQKFYIRVKKLFTARIAKGQMVKRQIQQQALNKLGRMPDVIAGMLQNAMANIQGLLESNVDQQNVRQMIQMLVTQELEHHFSEVGRGNP